MKLIYLLIGLLIFTLLLFLAYLYLLDFSEKANRKPRIPEVSLQVFIEDISDDCSNRMVWEEGNNYLRVQFDGKHENYIWQGSNMFSEVTK